MLKGSFAASGLNRDGAELLVDYKECKTNKANQEALLKASDSKLFDD